MLNELSDQRSVDLVRMTVLVAAVVLSGRALLQTTEIF